MVNLQSTTIQADLTGGPIVPIFAATIYCGYRIYQMGLNSPASALPSVMVMWGLISMICVASYVSTAMGGPGRSWGKAASSLSVLIPYAYALFMIFGLGVWDGCQSVRHHLGIPHVLFTVFWFFAGWRVLYKIAAIQRFSAANLT